MNTGSKLALAGAALVMSVTAMPAAAAPGYFQGEENTSFMIASRDSGELQDEREARKAKKPSSKKDSRKDERAREQRSDEPGYGYGYERRYPTQPTDPRFDDRRHR